MPNKIERRSSVSEPIYVTSSVGKPIPYGASGGGLFVVEAAAGGCTSLAWGVVATAEGTPMQMMSGTTPSSTTIAVGNAYALPDELFAAPFIVIATNAGTATIRLCVKG